MKIMQRAYKKLVEKAEGLEKKFGSLENFAISTNFEDLHTMKMREELSAQYGKFTLHPFFDDKILRKEFLELELADLCDLQKFDGEFDGEFV